VLCGEAEGPVAGVKNEWTHMSTQMDIIKKRFADGVLSGVLDKLPPDRAAGGGNFGINLKPDEGPSNQPPRRLGVHLQPEMERQIAELLARGYIRHSNSEFGAPVLFVRKKNGSWLPRFKQRCLSLILMGEAVGEPTVPPLVPSFRN